MDKKYTLEQMLYYLSDGNEDEQEAIKKYCELLYVINHTTFTNSKHSKLLKDLYEEVKEYISEEMKHSKGLSDFFTAFTEIVPEND